MRPVQNRMEPLQAKISSLATNINYYSTFKSSLTAYVSVLKPFSLQNMHYIGVFFSAYCFGLLKYSRKSKRLIALVTCVLLVQKASWALSILIYVNRILGRIKSSRFIRTKVDFHGNPTSVLYFLHKKFIWNLVLSRSSQCFGPASEPIKLQETIYQVLVLAPD